MGSFFRGFEETEQMQTTKCFTDILKFILPAVCDSLGLFSVRFRSQAFGIFVTGLGVEGKRLGKRERHTNGEVHSGAE